MFMAGAAVVLAGVVVWYGGPLAGQPAKEGFGKDKEPRKITTSGSATVRVQPNCARLFFVIEDTAPTIKLAREANKKHVESVLTAIHGKKIPDLKMKSTNVQMAVIHSQDDKLKKLPEILGYRVTYTFTVLVSSDDSQKLGSMAAEVLDVALDNGANAVEQISFFRDDLTEARREALSKATADAVANAKALAAGDNRILTDVVEISGNPEYHMPNLSNTMFQKQVTGAPTEIIAGQLEVTCRVNVTCTYGANK
jgi:uncharacterized protein YggE